MKKTVALCSLGLFSLASTVALAEEANSGLRWGGFAMSGNVTLTTDYVSRGLTASDHDPALQGAINVNHDTGIYASAWASNIDLKDGEGTALEIDLTLGFAKTWENGFGVDFGLIQYLYPKSPKNMDYDYREYFAGVGYKLIETDLKAKYYYSDDYSGPGGESASYLDLSIAQPLPRDFTLKGHFGHTYGDFVKASNTQGIKGFNDYSVGLATEWVGLGFELTYIGVERDGRIVNAATHANDRVTLMVSKSF